MRRISWFLVAVAAQAACVDKGPGGSGKQIDPAYIEQNLLTEAPATLDNQVNASLGEKVVYLGNEVDVTSLKPGGKVTVVHYWKVIEPPGEAWRIFSHVQGARPDDWMNVDSTDMRIGYPASKWKAGDIIRDEQKFALKDDWKSPHAELLVGMYPKGKHQVAERMPVVTGPADDEHRVKAVRFTVGGAAASSEPDDGYAIRKVDAPIAIDGKADEAAWAAAPWGPAFADAKGGPALGHQTRAKLLYDDENLYVFIEAADDDIYSSVTERDGDLWKEDVVELFIDADRNRRGYVELQVNPNNTHLDYWFAHTRAQEADKAWSADMTSAVQVRGTAGDRGDRDQGWDVEIAIPLAAAKGNLETMKVTIPPALGDQWNLNVIRGEKKKGQKNSAAASWNQIPYSDWHALGDMATVTFADATGNTTAVAQEEGQAPAPEEGEPATGKAAADEEARAAPAADEAKAAPAAAPRKAPVRTLEMKPKAPVEPRGKTAAPE